MNVHEFIVANITIPIAKIVLNDFLLQKNWTRLPTINPTRARESNIPNGCRYSKSKFSIPNVRLIILYVFDVFELVTNINPNTVNTPDSTNPNCRRSILILRIEFYYPIFLIELLSYGGLYTNFGGQDKL